MHNRQQSEDCTDTWPKHPKLWLTCLALTVAGIAASTALMLTSVISHGDVGITKLMFPAGMGVSLACTFGAAIIYEGYDALCERRQRRQARRAA